MYWPVAKQPSEIAPLRSKIGVAQWPAIIENGAGLLAPYETQTTAANDCGAVRAALDRVPPDLRQLFRGFGDVTVEQLAAMTGLLLGDAALAQRRSFSEPGQWSGSSAQKKSFLAALAADGVTAKQGGAF
ncbi:hypothetical protein [Yoonia sp. GPGPB17]|uniref:hypothetical protein n=1 Tax=Yoonia sp. GPGPB17 TaxID=3026147 RepID=UPI0030EB7A8F